MSAIVDQYKDKNQGMYVQMYANIGNKGVAEKLHKLPEPSKEETELNSNDFAWQDKRLFPIDTVGNTFKSKVYFEYQKHKIPADAREIIERKLNVMLSLYNIDVNKMFSDLFKGSVKAAAEEAPVLMDGFVKTAEDIDSMAAIFESDWRNLDMQDRLDFADELVKAAQELGCEVHSDTVLKYAGMLDTDMDRLYDNLSIRASAARRAGVDGSEYTKLAFELAKVNEPADYDEMMKLACTIHEIDVATGLAEPKYDNKFPCAFGVVFNKTANEDASAESGDASYNDDSENKAKIVARYGEESLDMIEDDKGAVDPKKLKKVKAMVDAYAGNKQQ